MNRAVPPPSDSTIRALRALRSEPPPGFAGRVLARVGLTEPDRYVRVDSPAGSLFVAFNAAGVCHVLVAGVVDDDPQRFVARHETRFGRPVAPADQPPSGLVTAARTGRGRLLHYDLRGLTDFEQAVLRAALDIPRGEVRPYQWIAEQIGRHKAVRAVGTALGHNPIPVLIPCHRVIRSDGQPGDYGYGPQLKQRLLTHEGVDLARTQRLARAGIRYIGSDATHIYCLPTCHAALRITAPHLVPFRSPEQAGVAGYRPCKQCRPTAARTA